MYQENIDYVYNKILDIYNVRLVDKLGEDVIAFDSTSDLPGGWARFEDDEIVYMFDIIKDLLEENG